MRACLLALLALCGRAPGIVLPLPPPCDSAVFCHGELLHQLQMAQLSPDSKTFVDKKLVAAPDATLHSFDELMAAAGNAPSKPQLEEFVAAHFEDGNELEPWTPEDYDESPAFLQQIPNATVREFAQHLVQLWPKLAKKVKAGVEAHPELYSIIPVPHGFVVPGGRFREYYYWDSYWVLHGLLISGMTETARGMIENFFSLVERFGFVPNGGRVYYLNRSQPPMLTSMAYLYFKQTKDVKWLEENIHVLEMELEFWLQHRTLQVAKDGAMVTLAHYSAESFGPRPESYIEDYTTAEGKNIPAASSLKHPAYISISKQVACSDIVDAFLEQLDSQLVKLSRNKLLAAAIILTNMLPAIEASKIPATLTKNFVAQVLQYYRANHSRNHDDSFQAAMTRFFAELVAALQRDAAVKTKLAVLKRLLFYPGTFMVEGITKTKVLQQLVQTLPADGVKKLAKLYKEVLAAEKQKAVGEGAFEPWLNVERHYAAQLLVKLLNHPSMQGELAWKTECLKLLIDLSVVRQDGTNVGAELAASLRETFFRSLDQKFSKLEDMHALLKELVDHTMEAMRGNPLRNPLDEEETAVLEKTLRVTSVPASDEDKSLLVFQVLFLQMALQLFKDRQLAVSSLQELFECYERVKQGKREGDLEWIEVVVDLFLNLLSHNSHLLRSVTCSVFPYLCKHLTPSSVHQILSVLDPKSQTNPLSADSDSESDEEGDDAEDSDGKEEESEEEEDEPETVNDRLRTAVREALGRDCQTDEESVDLDAMSDSEGHRLDEALANAFKQFKPNRGKSKKQKKTDQALTHFRARVLDLIEIYLEAEPAMISALEIMLALLQTLEFTIRDEHQLPLQARLKSVLKKLTAVRKFGSVEGVSEDVLGGMLASLLGKGTKSTMMVQDMSEELSECCVFIIKCSQNVASRKLERRLRKRLTEDLSAAVGVYFNQRDCLIPYSLFKALLQLNWKGNLDLVPLVFEYSFSATTRPFRRSQALELLKLFYLNRRLEVKPDKFRARLGQSELDFCAGLAEMLDAFCANPLQVTLKERTVYHVFNLLKAMAAHNNKNEDIDWKGLGAKIREYRSHVTLSKDAKTAYNQLCAKLNIPNVVKMKQQVVKLGRGQEEDAEDAAARPRAKKAAGEMENTRKQRKEAKDLRISSLSEGLSAVTFSNVDVSAIRNGGLEQEEEEEVPRKHKKMRLQDGEESERKRKKHKHGNAEGDSIGNGHSIEQIPHKKKRVK